MGRPEDNPDSDRENKRFKQKYKNVKFEMKNGKRYLGLPDSPKSKENEKGSPNKPTLKSSVLR
jgi:hypothetical protein